MNNEWPNKLTCLFASSGTSLVGPLRWHLFYGTVEHIWIYPKNLSITTGRLNHRINFFAESRLFPIFQKWNRYFPTQLSKKALKIKYKYKNVRTWLMCALCRVGWMEKRKWARPKGNKAAAVFIGGGLTKADKNVGITISRSYGSAAFFFVTSGGSYVLGEGTRL